MDENYNFKLPEEKENRRKETGKARWEVMRRISDSLVQTAAALAWRRGALDGSARLYIGQKENRSGGDSHAGACTATGAVVRV